MDIRVLESMKECVQATLKRVGDEPNIYIPLTTRNPENPSKVSISVGVRGRTISHTVPKDNLLYDEVKHLILELDKVKGYEIRESGNQIVVPYKDRIILGRAGERTSSLTFLHIHTLMDILTTRPSTSKIEKSDHCIKEPANIKTNEVLHVEFCIAKDGTKKELKSLTSVPLSQPTSEPFPYRGWHLRYGIKMLDPHDKRYYTPIVGTPMSAVVIECASKSQTLLVPFNRKTFHFITSCLGMDEEDKVKYKEQFIMCTNRANTDEISPIAFKEVNSTLTDYQKNVEVQANATPDSLIMEVPNLT